MPDTPLQHVDALVIGGGAAGLMCARVAAQRGRSVVLLERNERLGKKILISGGGRCNFTNLGAGPGNFLSARPDFCKSPLARFTPDDFLALVEAHGIPYHEKKLGQQFCDGSSREIVEMLEAECREAGAEVRLSCRVDAVLREGEGFRVETSHGAWLARSLVVATGGLSFPKLGASDFGHRLARQFGLPVVEPRPGLVPFTWAERDWAELSGVSVFVAALHDGARFEENLLFTHRGLSGPAILQISSYWKPGETVHFDLLPGLDAARWLREHRNRSGGLVDLLAGRFPRRFSEIWCARNAPDRPLAQLSGEELDAIGGLLNRWPVRPSGTEGYEKAEVTLGGVAVEALASKTMEARAVPGLYFIGEVVDVTGWLGGYNFQWAWASGNAAGLAV